MTTQAGLWTAAGAALALALAVAAEAAEWRRRHRRRALDAVGWVPWRGLQVLALFAAVVLAALALRS